MSFEQDLSEANIIEKEVAEIFSKLLKRECFVSKGYDKGGDIFYIENGGKIYVAEVKHDKKCIETGNVAFEISFNGNPSGIFDSQSKFIIYKIEDLYCRNINETLCWLTDNNFKIISGGDNKASEMYLVPLNIFKSFFKKFP